MDIYADDLSIYLEYNKTRESENLKIKLDKTYLTIFGKTLKKKFVDELKIKWCTEFKRLDMKF